MTEKEKVVGFIVAHHEKELLSELNNISCGHFTEHGYPDIIIKIVLVNMFRSPLRLLYWIKFYIT